MPAVPLKKKVVKKDLKGGSQRGVRKDMQKGVQKDITMLLMRCVKLEFPKKKFKKLWLC